MSPDPCNIIQSTRIGFWPSIISLPCALLSFTVSISSRFIEQKYKETRQRLRQGQHRRSCFELLLSSSDFHIQCLSSHWNLSVYIYTSPNTYFVNWTMKAIFFRISYIFIKNCFTTKTVCWVIFSHSSCKRLYLKFKIC